MFSSGCRLHWLPFGPAQYLLPVVSPSLPAFVVNSANTQTEIHTERRSFNTTRMPAFALSVQLPDWRHYLIRVANVNSHAPKLRLRGRFIL